MNLKDIINQFGTAVNGIEHRLTNSERVAFDKIKDELHDLQTILYLMGNKLEDINQAAEQLKERETPTDERDKKQSSKLHTE